MTAAWGVIVALTLLVGFLGLLVVGLLRSHAEIIRRLDSLGVRLGDTDQSSEQIGLTLGSAREVQSEGLAGISPEGEPLVLSPLVGSSPVLIAFLSTSCSSCTVFWEWIDGPVKTVEDLRFRMIIATLGADEESPTRAASMRLESAEVVMSSSAWQDYQVPGAPYFVLVDPSSTEILGEGTAETVSSLERFLLDSSGDKRWDQGQKLRDRTDRSREKLVDDELRRAGLHPGDPRLYPDPERHNKDSS